MVRFEDVAPVLPVADIEVSLAFYQETLGFSIDFERGNPVNHVALRRDAAFIHLRREPVFHTAVTFYVDDILKLSAQLEARRVPMVDPPTKEDCGMTMFSINDPDGHLLRFREYLVEDEPPC